MEGNLSNPGGLEAPNAVYAVPVSEGQAKKSKKTLIIAVACVVAALVIAGGVVLYFVLKDDDLEPRNGQKHLALDSTLVIPDDISTANSSGANDLGLIQRCASVASEWAKVIEKTLIVANDVKPQGPGPMAEVDCWRRKAAVLARLYEQLTSSSVRDILKLLETARNKVHTRINSFRNQAMQIYTYTH
ncbi:dynein heavy chain, partial [Kipferlia bialata]|eukprot:g6854.t1